ncbi:MAG TPA: deoxyribose-phosphate aldolase [Chthonomonadaceae bacterium]|nr:deoxyribose-phosphate aldolase [Chthonomonadaceae bacterium]
MNSQPTVAGRTFAEIARTIDHSLLRPELTEREVIASCELAQRYQVASVCVKPCDVPLAARILAGSDAAVGTVISFPHGSSASATKVFEAQQAMAQGAVELDMVLNIGWLRSGLDDRVREDIQAVVEAAAGKALVKVILENAYLTDEEKVRACRIVEAANADFIKTSSGFAPSGATIPDLKLMRQAVSPRVQVKAAGGIRTLDALLAALDAGATRVGATATQQILEEFKARQANMPYSVAPGESTGY